MMAAILSSGFIACNMYKIAERHIGRKMDNASMQLHLEIIQGDTVEYWDNHADKPVILLVHGFGATTKYQWFKQVEWLSEHYRVVMPNLFYFGNTRPGVDRYTVADQVELVHHLVQHLEITNYTICGVSYGGLIAFEMASKHPEGIDRMIAFDTPVKFMQQSDIESTCRFFDVPSVEELFVPGDPKGLKKLMYLASMKKSIVPAKWMTAFYEALYARDLEDKRALMTALLAGLEEYSEREYKLTIPILLIWGDNDPVVPLERGKMLQEHVGSNARFEIIHKGAHMPNMTKSKKFNKIFREFLVSGK